MAIRTEGLSRSQIFLIQGVLGVVTIGFVLPLGMVAVALVFVEHASARHAVDQGELFLAGANAAFTACLVLLSGRQEAPLNAMIAILFALAFVVIPCYGAGAYCSAVSLGGGRVAASLAYIGGGVAAGGALLVGLVFVVWSSR